MNESAMFMSPQNALLGGLTAGYTPDFDYLDNEKFDSENADLDGDMIGALPGDGHEKRHSPDDKDDADEPDAKRQETSEGNERGAKKPGRKPLTSEPTTKRKAQNRAAQRAFRERKEKHLKDLETKVEEMSAEVEVEKQEKGLLKAQVERLQMELREYRKRLSLSSGNVGVRGSPPLSAYTGQTRSNSNPSYGNADDFQFDFPKFGALPGSQIFGSYSGEPKIGVQQRSSISPSISQSPATIDKQQPPQQRRENSNPQSRTNSNATNVASSNGNDSLAQYSNNLPSVGYSNADNMHGFASTLPQMGGENPLGDLFSSNLLQSANIGNSNACLASGQQPAKASFDTLNGGESTAGLNRVFQFKSSSSTSDSASPSSSNWNHNGTNSSCGTSPEPSHNSPANQVDRSFSQTFKAPSQTPANYNIGLISNNLDFSVAAAETFDPVLFGDYRDPSQEGAFVNDFGNGFFDEALSTGPYDFGSPSNLFGILDSPQQNSAALPATSTAASAPSKNVMAQCDKARDGMDDDYGLSNTQAQQTQQKAPQQKTESKFVSCNHIWSQIQSNPGFQAGTFDLDSLCSELRAKARCSESGVMVDQDHVDKALKKLGKKEENGKDAQEGPGDMPSSVSEQESWDDVMRKMVGKA